MRTLALAAVLSLAIGGVASARPWNDPTGKLGFDAPNGWVMQVRHSGADGVIVLAGDANDECYLMAITNATTASANADAVRRATDPLSAEAWASTANSMNDMFPAHNATVTAASVDTADFWPMQHAQFSGAERPVVGALTSRPGLDFIGFCWTYGGPDASAIYQRVFASMTNASEATWRQQAEEQAAAHAAQQQANQAAQAQQQQQTQQQQQQQPQHRRGRGMP